MNAITAAVIATLNVIIRFRPFIRRSRWQKEDRGLGRGGKFWWLNLFMTSLKREGQPHPLSLAFELPDFDQMIAD
jgi:hypothetical protein